MQKWVKILLALAAAAFLAWGLKGLTGDVGMARKRVDMEAYWTAGRLLLTHQNPYDVSRVAAMESLPRSRAWRALLPRNPPWTLPLFLPLGMLGYANAYWLWDVASLAGVLGALALLANIYGPYRPAWAAFLPLFFVPTLLFLTVAQTGWLVLLGFALFLRCERGSPLAAGAGLFLATMKFNICFLFWPVFLIWAVERRQWRQLAGMGALVVGALGFVLIRDPAVVGQYLGSLYDTHLATQQFSSLAGLCRRLAGSPWPDFAFPALGVIWVVFYYVRARETWDWRERLPWVLLVSLALTPYEFFLDELLAVLAVAAAASAAKRRPGSRQLAALGLFLMVQAVILYLPSAGASPAHYAYSWTPAAWLVLYWLANRQPQARGEGGTALSAQALG
ncbi:MAG: glycosyltransferase family 87 protein [Terriglobales bacterium]